MTGLETLAYATAVIGGLSLFLFIYVKGFGSSQKTGFGASVPAIPGVPVIGNLLQLKEKKPHKTFTQWAETYGPIFSIKAGASTVVVVNSTDTAKEAMVTRFSSINTRKLSSALKVLTYDKCMVATSDYNDFHKMVKGFILRNVLGATAQKRHRSHRDTMIDNIIKFLHDHLETNPLGHVVLKESFESEIFGLALKQALGEDLESIYVPELQADLSREEIFKILVADPMAGAIEVDWRDFFPFLRWIPNKSTERKIQKIDHRRGLVMKALIEKQKKRIASGEERNCYVDFLLAESTNLTEKQIAMLIWETIIEISDTTLVTSEWAMYELAKDKKRQEILYQEIEKVCGSNKLTEEDLPQLQYLNCVFHETLRKYSPAPIVPLRYAHENTTLGGFHVPAGTEIALNLYGCNMNKKQWKNPEKWKPERFLDVKYDQADLHKTMAFGGGKRVCAGALQASLIAGAAIGRLIQEFEWRLVEGEEEDVDTKALTSQKLYPMKAIITPRSRHEK